MKEKKKKNNGHKQVRDSKKMITKDGIRQNGNKPQDKSKVRNRSERRRSTNRLKKAERVAGRDGEERQ